MKKDKKDVRYSDGMKARHCGVCEYYDNHTCAKVKGKIQPSKWCTLFKRKT